MKKTYMKPGLFVEQFSLSQSVAAGCGAPHNSTIGGPMQATKQTCGWGNELQSFWIAGIQTCTTTLGPDVPFDGICYNNPSGGHNIFNS